MPIASKTPPSLTQHGRVKGLVELVDPAVGISGWASDLENPQRRLEVELLADDVLVTCVKVDQPRPDMPDRNGAPTLVGFHFGLDALKAAQASAPNSAQLGVRVRDTEDLLPSAVPLPLLSALTIAAAGMASPAAGHAILSKLAELRKAAAGIAPETMGLSQQHLGGFIEQLSIGDDGIVWISGWMQKVTAADISVLVVDGQRHPAGLSLCTYDREDLNTGAQGFIAALHTDWRPRAQGEFLIVTQSGDVLRSAQSPRFISKREFVEHFRYSRSHRNARNSERLFLLLDNVDSWELTDGLSSARVQAAIEELYILPSFGCFAVGWVLSPLKAVTGFALKMGSSIMRCDPSTLSYRERPDLQKLANGCDLLPQRAGFTAMFRGEIPTEDMVAPTLKILLADGTSSNHAVHDPAMRRIGIACSADQMRHLYPSLSTEPFFPDFAEAMLADRQRRHSHAVVSSAHLASRQFIMVLPEGLSDIHYVFAFWQRHFARLPNDMNLMLVAGQNLNRPQVIRLFAELDRAHPGRCGLSFVSEISSALFGLPEILEACEAENFLFFGSSTIPEPELFDALTQFDARFRMIALTDLAGHGQRDHGRLAFGWSTDALRDWLSTPRSVSIPPLDDDDTKDAPVMGGIYLSMRPRTPLEKAIDNVAVRAKSSVA